MATRTPLRIRLLGELQVAHGNGPALKLPASRKTRALLGFLVATGQPHRRQRLCDLLWDGPDDPRAELRWCLSKIRPLLSKGGAILVADRERVSIRIGSAAVDVLSLKSLLSEGITATSIDALKDAASLFGGEFLDGLELPVCYRYQEWCMAEREALSRLRLGVLAALVERLHGQPAEALPYAHALTLADPLSEAGHAAIVRLLTQVGRNREALGHYQRARRIFETELGVPPSEELEQAYLLLKSVADTSSSIASLPPAHASLTAVIPSLANDAHFIGRDAERAKITTIVAAIVQRQTSDFLLVIGEAGIGKSYLLRSIDREMVSASGSVYTGRCFEAEATRPYGVWFDILKSITRGRTLDELPPFVGALVPELGAAADASDRGRLFEAVVELLRQVSMERPLAILIDDIHWIDEASSSLLHYIGRHLDAIPSMLIVCTAREGEIEDNAGASNVLRSLAREGRSQRIELGPLSPEETAELVRLVDPALDGNTIYTQSDGNPLFAVGLAQARRRGEAEPGPTVEALIEGQLASLTEQAREVLLWAAAYGGPLTPYDLARAARIGAVELLTTLGELERHGLVRPISDEAYDFAHDLVRQTAYRTVSQPRRKLIHRHIAKVLEEVSSRDNAFAADLAYHAELAGDYETAARACTIAGERAMRLFANNDAATFADRGLRHIERMAEGAAKVDAQISLLKLRILAAAGPGMRPLPPLIDTVTNIATAAETFGLQSAAATAHYLLSVLHQEAGDTRRAETSTLRAAAAGRSTDKITRANQLANTARCLLELETGITRSRELIGEADALVAALGLELCELHWARGLLQRWDGEAEGAIASIDRALALARGNEDRWREYKCLTWLAMLAQEVGRYDEMRDRCSDLRLVAARLGEDETPFVTTLLGLALLASEESSATGALEHALDRLRNVDDKSHLAYALNTAASLHLRAGRLNEARMYATEASKAASAMRRDNELTLAKMMLARVGEPDRDDELDSILAKLSDRDGFSARVRSSMLEF